MQYVYELDSYMGGSFYYVCICTGMCILLRASAMDIDMSEKASHVTRCLVLF